MGQVREGREGAGGECCTVQSCCSKHISCIVFFKSKMNATPAEQKIVFNGENNKGNRIFTEFFTFHFP